MAMLIERTQCRWPLWLSPCQFVILPVHRRITEYANQIRAQITAAGFLADIMHSKFTLRKRVHRAYRAKYNYILIVGDREQRDACVSVRARDSQNRQVHGVFVNALIRDAGALVAEHK